MAVRQVTFSILFALALISTVTAAPLNLVPTKPDIFSDSILVTYDAGSDSLLAQGYSWQLVDTSLTTYPISGAQGFSISAIIDGSGNAVSGSLSITGTISALSAGSPLLTGSLIAFGFPNSGDEPLEFLFEVTGGSLAYAGMYGVPGPASQIGVILSQTGSNYIDWQHSFDNYDNIIGAVADSFAIPEPATCMFLAFGVLALSARRGRTRVRMGRFS